MSNVKRALQLASVASMIYQFNMSNIMILKSLGYEVDVVADFTNPGTITVATAETFKKSLIEMGVRVYDIEIPRVLNIPKIVVAYEKIKRLIKSEHYNLIHCHSPIGGAICRLAARSERKYGTKVIYTAHGFHFYKGAPLKNWMFFYPIENYCSRHTDVLITITKEDYELAKSKMNAKKVEYVPGVGIDVLKFADTVVNRKQKRAEIGVPENAFMLLSVGELNENKNHKVVIEALSNVKDPSIYYVVAGVGNKRCDLEELATGLGVNLCLLGYRKDINELDKIADVFVLPSIREGLNVSVMEAMASGLPCIVSDIRGNSDLVDEHGGFLCNPFSAIDFAKAIEKIKKDLDKQYSIYNARRAMNFDKIVINSTMKDIYSNLE